MTNDSFSNRPRVIKALRLLQAKIGGGAVDQQKIQKMQNAMDGTGVDFVPLAETQLHDLAGALDRAGTRRADDRALINDMIEPVMQMKANGAMFGYALVSNLANVVLYFLESIDTVDDDVIEIVAAHHKTLSMIIDNKMSGSGGVHGARLESELRDACKRYFTKKGRDISFVPLNEELVNPSDE